MSKTETTLILFKPTALERGLVGVILARFEQAGLALRDIRWIRFTPEVLKPHYAELNQKNSVAYERTVRYLSDKEGIAVLLNGPNAIAKVRALVGPTDPLAAPAGTIRGDFGSDSVPLSNTEGRSVQNMVHAADSLAAAEREIALWFPERRASG